MLGDAPLIAFVSTADPDASRTFYAERLGLEFVSEEPYALVFEAPNAMLRIAKVEEVTPAPWTVLGREVEDVASAVESLSADGVEFLFYDDLPQDERGVATFPDGARIARFSDPDRNVLSISSFPGERET